MGEEMAGTGSGRSLRLNRICDMPSAVLHTVCEEMDSQSERDWMRFASRIVTDQTELRLIRLTEKTGRSRTEELMWWWGMRLGTVQELLQLLNELEFYRTTKVISDWISAASYVTQPSGAALDQTTRHQSPVGSQKKKDARVTQHAADIGPSNSGGPGQLPNPPPPPTELLYSVQQCQDEAITSTDTEDCSFSKPQQETNDSNHNILWSMEQLKQATSNFSDACKISEGRFGDTYIGQRCNTLYVIKRLMESNDTNQRTIQKLCDTELQIRAQCCHLNILQVLGCCEENGVHFMIYQHMPNGSLEDRLQCRNGSDPLSWEKRITISIGLTTAIQFLHSKGIIHGNIKSSNVLLDKCFTPKLGHAGVRFENKTEFTHVKTMTLQGYLTYLPEDFLRHGQITEKVDIFGCGIVLAEMLTGMKAMDTTRQPVFLKDLFLWEVGRAKEMCSKVKNVEEFAAEEICSKYLDKKAEHLPFKTALQFATAVCVCLRKKSSPVSEVRKKMEMLEIQANTPLLKVQTVKPEEVEDTSVLLSKVAYFPEVYTKETINADTSCLQSDNLPDLSYLQLEGNNAGIFRIPCELDESEDFVHFPCMTAFSFMPQNGYNMDHMKKTLPVSMERLNIPDCPTATSQEPVETSSSWIEQLSPRNGILFPSINGSRCSPEDINWPTSSWINQEPTCLSVCKEKRLDQNAVSFKNIPKESSCVPQEQLQSSNKTYRLAEKKRELHWPAAVQVDQTLLNAPEGANGLSLPQHQMETSLENIYQDEATLTRSVGIEMNAAKREIMERIDLYSKGEIDSGLLFES